MTYVEYLLGLLATQPDGEWNTANATHPIRINEDDSRRLDTDTRPADADLTEGVLLRVSGTGQTRSPIGTEFSYQTGTTAEVEIEALHEDKRGTVANAAAFGAIVNETQRALATGQTYPETGGEDHTLIVGDIEDTSANNRNHYRVTFDVTARGYRGH